MVTLYGVDTSKPVTAIEIRNAIIRCFTEAHEAVTKLSFNEMVKSMPKNEAEKFIAATIESLVRKAFSATGGDFNQPTKDSLVKVMDHLAEYSKKFRYPSTIQTHYNEIWQLIKLLG